MIGLKQLLTKISSIVNMYGEVGAIYITTANTNPATFFGGQWEKIEGRFLIGAGGSVGVNVLGGAMNASISAAHLPKHNHQGICSGDAQSARGGDAHTFLWKSASGGKVCKTTVTGNGTTTTHNNIPPYYVVHIWRRRDATATLTYDVNGGVYGNVPASQTISDNEDCYLTSHSPTKSSYVFLGWSTNQNAVTPEYQPGALFKLKGVSAQTTTLYAVWVSETLNMNLLPVTQRGESRIVSAEGGTIGGPPTIQYGNAITVTATPKTGYVFKGWTTSINSLAFVSTDEVYTFTPSNHTTLYGVFEKQTSKFYIDGLAYQFDNGMTWEEWARSPYNNSNDIEISKGYVISINSQNAGYSKYIYLSDSNEKVFGASAIIVNGSYYTGKYLELAPETLTTYTLNLTTVNATVAEVIGGGQYEKGALVVAEALNLGIIVGHDTIIQGEIMGGETRKFLGWFTNSSGSGTPVSRKPTYSFNITGNTNLYAVFKMDLGGAN